MIKPFRKIRLAFERRIARAWGSLVAGWRETIRRGSGEPTLFAHGPRQTKREDTPDFPRGGVLASEVWETSQAVIVRIELPGIRKEDVDISVHRGRLQIRGEKRNFDNQPSAPRHYHLMERAFGSFERCISLPPYVDAKRVEAAFQDGVVTAILPKTETVPPATLVVK